MAKKENKNEGMVLPKGAFFTTIGLDRDMLPAPAAYRIVQLVNRGDKMEVYVSENAYVRAELMTHRQALERKSLDETLGKGVGALQPVKGKIHWIALTEEFLTTGKGPRINPETGDAE